MFQQLSSARQRPNLGRAARVDIGVSTLQLLDKPGADLGSGLAKQRVDQQSATHADPAMNSPDGEPDPHLLKGFTPCQHVLVDAVDERPVEIE
jgi:hypothetical protein